MAVAKLPAAPPPPVLDDEYKEATQAVVDDRMRTDVLGPHICKVLADHTPAQTAVTKIIKDSITQNPEVQQSVETVIKKINDSSKIKWFQRFIGAIGVIVVGLVLWLIQKIATALLPPLNR